jgi:hypothetical protein
MENDSTISNAPQSLISQDDGKISLSIGMKKVMVCVLWWCQLLKAQEITTRSAVSVQDAVAR